MRTAILALLAVALLAVPLSAASSPSIEELAQQYLSSPPEERRPLLVQIWKVMEDKDIPLLWSLLPDSSPEEIQETLFQIAFKPWATPRMPLFVQLYQGSGERLRRELIRAWMKSGHAPAEQVFLLKLFAEAEKGPREQNLERLAEAFEKSADAAERRKILLQVFLRARAEDFQVMWRLLRQAEASEADLLVDWFDIHPLPSFEAGLSLYQSARTEDEKDRALWVSAVGNLDGVGELHSLARAFHSCPNAAGRSSLVDRIGRVAGAEDLPVMLEILRGSSVEEARTLSRWFSRHPSPEAVPDFRERLGPIHEDLWIPNALAAAGDPGVLEWAVKNLREPESGHRVLATSILSHSPLPAAAEQIRQLLAEGGNSLYLLMYAFVDLDNWSPYRWWFFEEVLKSGEHRLAAIARLRYLAEHGEETAKRLLSAH